VPCFGVAGILRGRKKEIKMEQLLLHLFGDYVLQNDWMALNKKNRGLTGLLACLTHCILYGLPFLLITNYIAVLSIILTHFIIDRTNIVAKFLAIRNNVDNIDNFGFAKNRPFALSIWLLIITDNTFHLIINYLLIKYIQ